MTLSPARKRLNTVFGLLILGAMGYIVWPFIFGAHHMQAFCSELAVGQSFEQVKAKVDERGYRLNASQKVDPFVYDHASMGRFSCNLHFSDGGLESAQYLFLD